MSAIISHGLVKIEVFSMLQVFGSWRGPKKQKGQPVARILQHQWHKLSQGLGWELENSKCEDANLWRLSWRRKVAKSVE